MYYVCRKVCTTIHVCQTVTWEGIISPQKPTTIATNCIAKVTCIIYEKIRCKRFSFVLFFTVTLYY